MQALNERTKLLYHPVNDVGGQPREPLNLAGKTSLRELAAANARAEPSITKRREPSTVARAARYLPGSSRADRKLATSLPGDL